MALPHPAHLYQLPTCSNFLSLSDLPPALAVSILGDSCHAATSSSPPAVAQVVGPMLKFLSIISLLPLTVKTLSPPFPSWHMLLGVPGLRSALLCPPQNQRRLVFSCQLGAMGRFPSAACAGLPSPACTPRVRGAWPGGLQQGMVLGDFRSYQWGPVLCLSTHAEGSWRSRDGRRGILGTGPRREEVREGMGGNWQGKAPREGLCPSGGWRPALGVGGLVGAGLDDGDDAGGGHLGRGPMGSHSAGEALQGLVLATEGVEL